MKEDALDLAKGRVYKLELQLKEEMKKSLKESQAKDFYRARGGQWKSSFMELSDRVGRKACKVRDKNKAQPRLVLEMFPWGWKSLDVCLQIVHEQTAYKN